MQTADPFDRVGLIPRESSLTATLFRAIALHEGLYHLRLERWPTRATDLGDIADRALVSEIDREYPTAIVRFGKAVAYLSMGHGYINVTVASRDRAEHQPIVDGLRGRFPSPDPWSDGRIPLTIWWSDPHGRPESRSTDIAAPSWDAIRTNYAAPTRTQVETALSFEPAAAAGQTFLWHGQPGTGKTYALRSLGWEWRAWCSVHVVIDAERFFGGSADYMVPVVTGQAGGRNDHDRWRLLVLEDAGELLSADAKERVGAGLSRFLNLVDGLVGEGLRVLVLVTTNEPLKRLHPAVSRPGRCFSEVEFRPLDVEEANAWLDARGVGQITSPATIADLYAIAGGREREKVQRSIGFGLGEEAAA